MSWEPTKHNGYFTQSVSEKGPYTSQLGKWSVVEGIVPIPDTTVIGDSKADVLLKAASRLEEYIVSQQNHR